MEVRTVAKIKNWHSEQFLKARYFFFCLLQWQMVLEKAPATSPGDLAYCRKADHEVASQHDERLLGD